MSIHNANETTIKFYELACRPIAIKLNQNLQNLIIIKF